MKAKLLVILFFLLISSFAYSANVYYVSWFGGAYLGGVPITDSKAKNNNYIIYYSTLDVNSDANIRSLTLTNNSTLTVSSNSTINISRDLNSDGNLVINGEVNVSGSAVLSGETTVNGNLSVADNATISGDMVVNGDLHVGGNLTIDGDVVFNGNVVVDGAIINNNSNASIEIAGSVVDLSNSSNNIENLNITNSGILYIGEGNYGTIVVDNSSRLVSTGGATVDNLIIEQSSNSSILSLVIDGITIISQTAQLSNNIELNANIQIDGVCTVNQNTIGRGLGIFYISDGASFVNYASSLSIAQTFVKTWSDNGYANVSIPFNGQIHNFPKKMYEYIESSLDTGAIWSLVKKGTVLTRGVGYSTYNIGTKEFTGYSDLSEVNVPVTYTENVLAPVDDWGDNFVGNPYACPISYNAFISANSSLLGNNILFWDDGRADDGYYRAGDYIVKNSLGASGGSRAAMVSGDNIASFQGFYVEARSNGNVTFNSAMILPNADNSNYLKSEQNIVDKIRLSAKSDSLYNDVLIGLFENETNLVNYKAKKVQGNIFFSFYINSDSNKYAISAFDRKDSISVDLGIYLTTADTLEFSINYDDYSADYDSVYIYNCETGTRYNLINDDPKIFISSKNSNSLKLICKNNVINQDTTIINDIEIDVLYQNSTYYSITGIQLNDYEKSSKDFYIKVLSDKNGNKKAEFIINK